MDGTQPYDENQWSEVETAISDPEEERVVYCALDSYMYVVASSLNSADYGTPSCFLCRPIGLGKLYLAVSH